MARNPLIIRFAILAVTPYLALSSAGADDYDEAAQLTAIR